MYKIILLSVIMMASSFGRVLAQQVLSQEEVGSRLEQTLALDNAHAKEQFAERLKMRMQRVHQFKGTANNPVMGSVFKNYLPENTGDNGLSDTFTQFVYEDAEGHMFFGAYGVDMWDGMNWSNFNQFNSPMPTDNVRDMVEDQQGNYWFATSSGLVRWEKMTEMFQIYTPDNSGIRSNLVNTLALDSRGRIWAGHNYNTTYEGGISVFNDNGSVAFTIADTDGLYGAAIEDIEEDTGKKVMYIATGPDPASGLYGGINVWDLQSAQIDTFYNMDNSTLPYNEVTSLEVDSDGDLWAGLYTNESIGHTEGGLVKFDGTTFTHYSQDKGDDVGKVIMSLYMDDAGDLWIGATEGLYTYSGSTFAQVTGGNDGSEPLRSVNDIVALSDGSLAFSKFNYATDGSGGGVSIWDPNSGSWEHISSRDGGVNSRVYFGADFDSQGNLWTTGFNGLQKFDGENWEVWTKSDGLLATYGWDLIVDQNDNVWVNSAGNGLTKVNANGTIETITQYGSFVESNYEASNGDLWFGDYYDDYDNTGNNYSNGILHFDGTNYTVYDSTDGLPTGTMGAVESISEDQQGRILAATYNGLYRLENGSFSKWMYDGYTSGGVYKLHLDSQDRLWISNGSMISMYDGTNWTHFDQYDGVEGYAEDIEEDMAGRVWLLQSNGAAVYENGAFYRVSPKNGVPSIGFGFYDLAPSRTDASVMAMASYYGGVTMSTTELPITISSLIDNPNDQGGWIRLSVGGYLLSSQYTGEQAEGWRAEINMDGNWEAAAPISPASAHSISVQVPVTKPDGATPDATNSFDFRVVAVTIDGLPLGFSETVNGYAEDNIAPSQVMNVSAGSASNNNITLTWDAVTDNDVDGYAIFEDNITDFSVNAPIAFSTTTDAEFADNGYSSLVVVAVDQHGNYGPASESTMVTSNERSAELPDKFSLSQNYPNPFNPTTMISYALPKSGHVRLSVFNMLGQRVATLINEVKPAGEYEVSFNADQMNSGMYIYRIEAGSFMQTRKMMLIK